MAAVTGKSLIVALEPTTSTWGTAVAPGATDQILVDQIGPMIDTSDMIPDPSAGYAWLQYVEKCRQNVNPELSFPLRWDGRFWMLIAQCMGLDTKTGAGDPYSHTMTLLDQVDGSDLFFTMATQLGPASSEIIHEWPSVKPYGFTFEGPDGNGYVHCTVRCIADTMLIDADATTAAADIDNVTHISLDSVLPPIVPFGNLRFRINTRAGDALDSGDNVKVKSFNFTFNRNSSQEWVSRGATASEWKSDEPIEDGIPEGTLQIELADFNNSTYTDYFQDETEMKAELYFAYDADHDITLSIPCMKLTQPDINVSGSARIPQSLTFTLMQAQSNPSGMAFTNWRLVVRSETSTAYE